LSFSICLIIDGAAWAGLCCRCCFYPRVSRWVNPLRHAVRYKRRETLRRQMGCEELGNGRGAEGCCRTHSFHLAVRRRGPCCAVSSRKYTHTFLLQGKKPTIFLFLPPLSPLFRWCTHAATLTTPQYMGEEEREKNKLDGKWRVIALSRATWWNNLRQRLLPSHAGVKVKGEKTHLVHRQLGDYYVSLSLPLWLSLHVVVWTMGMSWRTLLDLLPVIRQSSCVLLYLSSSLYRSLLSLCIIRRTY
jgi:hypothetical protein